MERPPKILYCGFCGYSSPHIGIGKATWAGHFRAVYSTGTGLDGSSRSEPKLSGVGLSRLRDDQQAGEYFAPSEPHQRYDDPGLTPHSLVQIRDVRPPEQSRHTAVPDDDNVLDEDLGGDDSYAWGFLFHDACWRLFEQACAPDAIDVAALWRVLLSVPCCCDVPNWNHTYGGLFTTTNARGWKFARIQRPTNLLLPSTFQNPFSVSELAVSVNSAIRKDMLSKDENTNNGNDDDDDGSDISNGIPTGVRAGEMVPVQHDTASDDPFSALPPELREMLLTYCASPDVGNLRLASRVMAAVPLTQNFYRSRFWLGRELQILFDGFLLGPAERRNLDWAMLYRKTRKMGLLRFAERNRSRIWHDTLCLLSRVLDSVARLSPLRGEKRWTMLLEGLERSEGSLLVEQGWRGCKTASHLCPGEFGLLRRPAHGAEVELPIANVRAVRVSLVPFFGLKYISGLRLMFAEPIGVVEIGYIAWHSETVLHVEHGLHGFHVAFDECGINAVGLITGDHMRSEYLPWAGDATECVGSSAIKPSMGVGFRMKALFVR